MVFQSGIIFDILKRWSRVKRWPRTQGFGVQSPWAYRYIRYVIAEHASYYAYEELDKAYTTALQVDRDLSRLYFRVANHCQARRWGLAINHCDMKADYVRCGCKSTVIVDRVNGFVAMDVADCDVLVMTLESNWCFLFESYATSASPTSLLIIEDIHSTRHARKIWKTIRDDDRCGITFDLYDCGLVFFDRSKHKQHYAVNY